MTWASGGDARTSAAEWKRTRLVVLARDGHACQIFGPRCVCTAREVDHIIPVSEGGTDDHDNLRAACGPCHFAKTKAEATAARRRRAARARHPGDRHPGLL